MSLSVQDSVGLNIQGTNEDCESECAESESMTANKHHLLLYVQVELIPLERVENVDDYLQDGWQKVHNECKSHVPLQRMETYVLDCLNR